MALTREQFDSLRAKGLSVQQIVAFEKGDTAKDLNFEEKKSKEGFLSRTFRSITEPVVTLATRPFQAVKAIGGATPEEQAITLPYYGKIKTVETGKDVLKDVGRAAETIALGIGGGGTASTIKTGLKGAILQSAKQGLIVGAETGALSGFGQALQEAEVQPSNVAYKTLFGAATGGATGGVLGAMTPIVVKGINYTKKFTNPTQITKELEKLNTEVFKPTPSLSEKWSKTGKNPIKTYTEIFGNKIPQVNKDNRFLTESVKEFAEQVDDVYKPASEGFNAILRNSPEVVDINKIKTNLVKQINQAKVKDTIKTTLLSKLDDEFNAIQTGQFSDKIINGKVPVHVADSIKDTFWLSNNWKNPLDKITNQSDYLIGKGWQKAVEDAVTDVNVKAYNAKLGDLINLRNYLLSKGGSLAGTGGKMTRLMARVVGSVAGAKRGPVGSIVGNLTGDRLAQIMIDPNMQPYRWLIKEQLKKLPKAEVLKLEQEANAILEKMFQNRMSTLALPAPTNFSTIAGKVTPIVKNQTNPIIARGATTFEKPAQVIKRSTQAQKLLQAKGQNPIRLK